MKKYKAVIIGCGRIGCEYDYDPKRKVISSHAGAFYENPKTELTAVCDLDPKKLKKAQKKWNIPSVYKDYKEMIRKERPDIISVCTWENSHAEIIKYCAKYKPKAIICEKPIAPSAKDAKQIIAACKKGRVLLQVNYMRRFSKLYQEIATFIKTGKLGKIQKITGHYGGGLMTNASHLIDLANFFTKEKFTKISAIKSKIKSQYKNDPNYAFIAETKSGAVFSLTPQETAKYLHIELEIFGEKGRITLEKSGFKVKLDKVGPHTLFSGFKELKPAKLPFKNQEKGQFMEDGLRELLKSLEKKTTSLCSGEDALETLEFVLNCKNNHK